MNTNETGVDVVKHFFAAFGRGDLDALVGTFHEDARIVAVRDVARTDGGPWGRYEGKAGAREFVATLGATFDTRSFEVDEVIGEGDVVFASGRFVHVVRSTGKPFRSDWALRCVVTAGTIAEYRFHEDSAAFLDAARP